MSRLDHRLEPEGEVRRFEVITGAIGRRRWSADDRAQILEETLVPGAVVSEVARRHGLTPQQLFTWRREARKAAEAVPAFVPAVIAPEPVLAAEPPADAYIAATAIVRGMAVATRDTSPFIAAGVNIICPWE